MCGIAGIIQKSGNRDILQVALDMSAAISHRGPDGEGFVVSDGHNAVAASRTTPLSKTRDLNYLPSSAVAGTTLSPKVLLAHRRLSIIDLSEAGHQPMSDAGGRLWITFNGEIYNFPELREELQRSGHTFRSACDTEVVLASYAEWGAECVHHFIGMWAFCILDLNRHMCFASRDRLGVKPFYYTDTKDSFAFASEQKAFFKAGVLNARVNERALHDYLVNGLLETRTENFFEGVRELWPGTNMIYNLRTHQVSIHTWFDPHKLPFLENEHLGDDEIIGRIRSGVEKAVQLRLRSDVEVGTCLSGGIDSSVIAMMVARQTKRPFHCFTASFPGQPFDEGRYAAVVAKAAAANHHNTTPTAEEFARDLDDLLYAQDVPIWDTSTYAQHRVMRLAKENGIKVVLDGQGADELFTGYHHHFTAKWNGLLNRGKFVSLRRDISAARVSMSSPFAFYTKERLKSALRPSGNVAGLLNHDFVKSYDVTNWCRLMPGVNEQLIDDITRTRLKIFLKCEDRCGMWHSVESRTPFSDDPELLAFMFSFNGDRKIQNGRLKYLLREAAEPYLPSVIYNRHDKKGFETPTVLWLNSLKTRMIQQVEEASLPFVNRKQLQKIQAAEKPLRLLLKLFSLVRMKSLFP